MSPTPNFHGQRATILHRPDEATDRLGRHLQLLGFVVDVRWAPLAHTTGCDVVLVDADEGWDGLLPWSAAETPVPLVALLGSEAPGRITWALDRGADALIAKPVAPSAVFPALVMAARRFAERREVAARMLELEERVRLRPLVLGAVRHLMATRGWAEDQAYRHLRRESMRQRLALEQCAAAILGSDRARTG